MGFEIPEDDPDFRLTLTDAHIDTTGSVELINADEFIAGRLLDPYEPWYDPDRYRNLSQGNLMIGRLDEGKWYSFKSFNVEFRINTDGEVRAYPQEPMPNTRLAENVGRDSEGMGFLHVPSQYSDDTRETNQTPVKTSPIRHGEFVCFEEGPGIYFIELKGMSEVSDGPRQDEF